MKILAKATLGVPADTPLFFDNLELFIEKQWRRLETIVPLCKKVIFATDVATPDNPIALAWIDLPVEIQGVRSTVTSGVFTVPFEYLSQADKTMYKNFNEVLVSEFQAGKNYLIPFTAQAVTDMMPDSQIYGVEGSPDLLFMGTHYLYMAPEKEQTRNGAQFTAIIFDIDVENTLINQNRIIAKSQQKDVRLVNNQIMNGGV